MAVQMDQQIEEPTTGPRSMMVSKTWVQGVAIVMLFGFFVMGILAYKTYSSSMPQPVKVTSQSGQVVFTGDEITKGQVLFQSAGLMQYGSILGHGAYLGPDFTADYLRRSATSVRETYLNSGGSDAHDKLVKEFRTNRYDDATGTLVFTDPQINAFKELEGHYATYFGADATKNGLRANAISDPQEIHNLTSFFAWTAWAAAADRPGLGYSYTNNWPAEKLVDNVPTGHVVVWSVLSLVMLLGGTGALFAVYGRWSQKIGWHGAEGKAVTFRRPGEVALTPSQRTVGWFFLVISLLFLVQTIVGAAAEHYRADLSNFFGFDLSKVLPYNLARTWHVQLSLFWTATSFLAAAIFLVPFISGRKQPRGQAALSYGLLGALVVVVFGSLISEAGSIFAIRWFRDSGLLSQQWEYLDLPRLWQILMIIGLALWLVILYRGLRGRLATESKGNMPWLFFLTASAIPAFYAVGLLAGQETTFSVADFWRFWVVHLWVEDFLELFTTVMVAYLFVMMGVVREKIALGIIYLDIILYSAGGVIGTMHHLYFSGTPVEHMALGAFFSAAEVIPLTFLTVEAWGFLQLGAKKERGEGVGFPHRWAVMFLVAVGFWNFLGAGIFGFLVNLPIVSYFQIGTALTANHAHAAMMGVYGMLSVGLGLFCLRYLIPAKLWPDRLAKISFWSLNIGLAWMVFASLLPLGVVQLYHSVNEGYFEARSLGFITSPGNAVLEWVRLPGDLVFILGGVLPFVWICWLGVRYRVKGVTDRHGEDALFSEQALEGSTAGAEMDRP